MGGFKLKLFGFISIFNLNKSNLNLNNFNLLNPLMFKIQIWACGALAISNCLFEVGPFGTCSLD